MSARDHELRHVQIASATLDPRDGRVLTMTLDYGGTVTVDAADFPIVDMLERVRVKAEEMDAVLKADVDRALAKRELEAAPDAGGRK